MRKFLLTLTAFAATLTASAEWTASFEPVNDVKEMKGIQTVTAANGSVYVSSSYNQGFTFAGKDVTDPEGLTSACVVKYSATGEELWAVSMEGAATIYALDADTDGTLYIAGNFTDAVKYTGTDGVTAEMTSETVYSAFVAKISADGKVEAMEVITPAADTEIEGSFLYYPTASDIHVTPSKLQVEGDKIYVSAIFCGDVAELSWEGAYLNVWDFMYMDNRSAGVFSLSKNDLSEAKSIATVQNTESVSYNQYAPEAFSFVAENGIVYVSFIGLGNLTLTTAEGTKDFTFSTDGNGSNEHAFVLATISETTATKTFNTAAHSSLAATYDLFMESDGDNLIIGGTYFGELPFNTEITTENNDIFVASVKKADNTTNWTYTSENESEAICMTTTDKVFVAATTGTYTVNLATGEATIAEQVLCAANGGTTIYTEETKVCISSNGTPASIENAIATAQEDIRYNLAGQVVDKSYKGFVIANGKKLFVK